MYMDDFKALQHIICKYQDKIGLFKQDSYKMDFENQEWALFEKQKKSKRNRKYNHNIEQNNLMIEKTNWLSQHIRGSFR